MPNDLVMYILVNNNLQMGKVKIASHMANSACSVVNYLTKYPTANFQNWMKNDQTKIVLKSHETQMLDVINRYANPQDEFWCDHTQDAGKTQVEEDSLTTLAFCPIPRNHRPEWMDKLRLL